MKTYLISIFMMLIVSLVGCASTYKSVGVAEVGIENGMSITEVVKKLKTQSNEIISVSDTQVKARGWWDDLDAEVEKYFSFHDGKLTGRHYIYGNMTIYP